jgi:hypothetical protein
MRFRKGVCPMDGKLCGPGCPVPSIDNFGNHYPGCARWRLKSKSELGLKETEPVAPKVKR